MTFQLITGVFQIIQKLLLKVILYKKVFKEKQINAFILMYLNKSFLEF